VNARWKVPPVDLARENAWLAAEAGAIVAEVAASGRLILGSEVERLEQQVAERLGVRFAVAVNSGTDAIALTLRGLGIGPGDEVVTVSNSFVATAGAVVQIGARPRFADVGEDELIDLEAVAACLGPRTRAVLAVHLRGRVADVRSLRRLTDAHGLALVEDCSQAFLAGREGMAAGATGDAGCFSLHPLKNPGALGDAGVITTQDAALAARLRQLRNHGLADRDTCMEWGVNSRLDALQAAFLRRKLDQAGPLLDRRAAVAARYTAAFAGLDGLQLAPVHPATTEAHYAFVVRIAERRDEVLAALRAEGIGALVHYPVPIHLQPAAAALGYRAGDLPVTERQAGEILTLPLFSTITDEESELTITAVTEVLQRQA
jgi:dTDP-4-amino-4,6-dideoxygalactose transaminase